VEAAKDGFHLTVGSAMAQPTEDESQLGLQIVLWRARGPSLAEGRQQAWIAAIPRPGHTAQMGHITMGPGSVFERLTVRVRSAHQSQAIIDHSSVRDIL
jgi:hypothetical protein